MIFTETTTVTHLTIVLTIEELESYSYWFSNRFIQDYLALIDQRKWKHGEEIALEICKRSH